jgi:hypothetical protein
MSRERKEPGKEECRSCSREQVTEQDSAVSNEQRGLDLALQASVASGDSKKRRQ